MSKRLWLALALAMLVFSSRLCVLDKFGVQEPFMDGFSEIEDYKAAEDGRFDLVWRHSISYHNEHRVFLMRWFHVLLFLANQKQWDPLLQACVTAVLTGLCVGVIVFRFGSQTNGFPLWFFSLLSASCFALPIAYENILWGWQSCFLLFLLFSLLTIGLMLSSRPLSPAWWCGLASAVLACGSLGPGFYAALSVCCTCALMMVRKRYRRRPHWITLCAALVVLILYLATIAGVKQVDLYKADSFRRFVESLLGNLSWPNLQSQSIWLAGPMWIPWTALVFASLFRRLALPRFSYAVIGLGIWVLAVTFTLSYMRGKYAPYVRYFDFNAINVVVNSAAVLECFRLNLYPKVSDRLKWATVGAWFIVIPVGLVQLSVQTWSRELPHRRFDLVQEQQAVRRFFATSDPKVLSSSELAPIVPFHEPFADALGEQLRDSEVKKFLPHEMKVSENPAKSHAPFSQAARFALRHSRRVLMASILSIIVLAFATLFVKTTSKQHQLAGFWRSVGP